MSIIFLFINKTLRLNSLTTRTALNAKISVIVFCVEAIIYLLLYNLHDCTFKSKTGELELGKEKRGHFSYRLFYPKEFF